MKKLTVWTLLAFLAVGSFGCASIPSQIPGTMTQACSLYQQVRPDVVKLRAYAVSNWAAIPPDAQETLKKLDSYLPELDRAGEMVCAISSGGLVESSHSIQWDDVLSTVVKAAALAADMKRQGVI
jgi:hypothetical protein